ncbi:hypothetical protein BH09MYX1_BH09MYX1_02160 [soil metagenome]
MFRANRLHVSSRSRREFLKLAAALGVTACGPTVDGEAPPPPSPDGGIDASPDVTAADAAPDAHVDTTVPGVDLDGIALAAPDYPLGVMAGDATSSRAMLWTKYDSAGELWFQIEAEKSPNGRAFVSRKVTATELAATGCVHVDADNLPAGTRCRYAFFVKSGEKLSARSPFGFVRSAIAADSLDVITFACTSCSNQNAAPLPVLSDAAERKLDFFVHAGDHLYADSATNLTEYRQRYDNAWKIAGLRALHAAHGMVLTWDDHEVDNNWNPETISPARFDAARKAFFEYRALRRDASDPDRVWRTLTWGKTLELVMLDARSERKPSTRNQPNAQFVSKAQMTWLKDRLKTSPAVFKLVVTSVPISNFPLDASGESDKWEGYPAQRDELLDYIRDEALNGVFFLSGDLHFGSIGSVGTTPARMKLKEILMGPAGSQPNNPSLNPAVFDKVISERNTTVFRVDPIKKELAIEFFGVNGSIAKKTFTI